jgi:hypothetical protein
MQAISIRSLLWLLFVRDWPWKILSFAIALMVYFSLRSEISNMRTIAVPIMGDGYVITSVKPKSAYVTLRGTKAELDQLYTPNVLFLVKPSITAKEMKEPVYQEIIRLSSSHVKQIGRLRVARIEPSFVNVQFERPIKKTEDTPLIPLPALLTTQNSTPTNVLATPVTSGTTNNP